MTKYAVHVALLSVQLFAATNAVIARMAFLWYDPGQEPMEPMVWVMARSVIATVLFTTLWWYTRYLGNDKTTTTVPPLSAQMPPSSTKSDKESLSLASPVCVPPLPSPAISGVRLRRSPFFRISMDSWVQQVFHLTPLLAAKIALLGVIGIPLNLTGFVYGVKLTDAMTAGAVACLVPVFCFLISSTLGIERLTSWKYMAICFVVLGNGVFTEIWLLFATRAHGPQGSSSDPGLAASAATSPRGTSQYYLGLAIFLVSVSGWSTFLSLQKPLLQQVHRVDFLLWYYWGGTVVMVAVALVCVGPSTVHRQLFTPGVLGKWSWISIFYSGCINATLPYYLIAFGIQHGGPILASAWNSMQPIFVVLEAMEFLGEQLTRYQVLGGILIMAGVGVSVYAHVVDARMNAVASGGVKGSLKKSDNCATGEVPQEAGASECDMVNAVSQSPILPHELAPVPLSFGSRSSVGIERLAESPRNCDATAELPQNSSRW